MAKLDGIVAWVRQQRPVRVLLSYTQSRGPLLAGGLSYQAIFAAFAAIWVGFAAAGLLISSNPELQDAFFNLVSTSVPGLFDTGDGTGDGTDDGRGAINPRELLQAEVLGWTGAIAFVGLLFTALGWLASCRDAVRTIFGLPGERVNFFLLKLRDVGLGLAFGAALLISSALLVFSTQALGSALSFLGFDESSAITAVSGRIVGLLLMFAVDTVVLAALFRVLSGLTIPPKRLLVGAMLGAATLAILKLAGTALLGGATSNPLLASFAVIIGLLIWFNLICQVVLLTAAWISVGMADAGLVADPRIGATRRGHDGADR